MDINHIDINHIAGAPHKFQRGGTVCIKCGKSRALVTGYRNYCDGDYCAIVPISIVDPRLAEGNLKAKELQTTIG